MPIDERGTGQRSSTSPLPQMKPRPLAHAVSSALCGLALCAATLPGAALAQAATAPAAQGERQRFSIAAGPLAPALRSLASAANLLLSFTPTQTEGRSTQGIEGAYTPQAALAALLAGTGLQAVALDNGAYVLRAAPPARPAAADEVGAVLPTVTVTAASEREHADGPVNGFVARRSATGTKTDTPLIEVPQSVSVIGREELDARGAQSVMEALRYVPGVLVDSYGVETRGTEWALMRGFDSNATSTLVDGLRLTQSNWIAFQTETYGLERIEVLRGPASVSYGQVEAGGTIHRISKRPDANAPREVAVQTGSYGRKQVSADVGGALNDDGSLQYRLVGLALDSDNQLRFANGPRANNERLYVAPSLTWKPNADTTLTVLAESLSNVSKGFSIYVVRNNQNTGLLRGDPDHLRYDQDQQKIGYQLEHRLNGTWTLRQNVRLARSTVENHFINQLGAPVGNLLARSARYGDDRLRQNAVDTNLQARFGQGRVTHTVLAGVDWSDAHSDYREFHAAPGSTPPLNLDAPVYGVAMPPADQLMISRTIDSRLLGLYLQDQIKFDQRWVFTLGGRSDEVTTRTFNRRNNLADRQRDRAFSGRAGLTYLAPNGLAPYLSYAESFVPQSLKTSAGAPYKPTRGQQWEVGVKYQPEKSEHLFTAALFDLTKSNVETYDPTTDDYLQTGQIRSRGLELEAKARLARGLDLYAAYTYNDVEVSRSLGADLGKTPIQVPRQMASVGFDYALAGALQGFSVGAGVRYVGRRYDDALNTRSTDPFTLVDAALRYDHGRWRYALNVANLFDKTYVASRAYGGYYPGSERSFTLSARYRF